jgi:hypothetical protein
VREQLANRIANVFSLSAAIKALISLAAVVTIRYAFLTKFLVSCCGEPQAVPR